MYQYSLIGIKPDAFSPDSPREPGSELRKDLPRNPQDFVNEFAERLRERRLRIVAVKERVLDRITAALHYQEHKGVFDNNYGVDKHDFLVGYLTSGLSRFMVVYGDNAVLK
jgi:nucleoside diphosphate kinase